MAAPLDPAVAETIRAALPLCKGMASDHASRSSYAPITPTELAGRLVFERDVASLTDTEAFFAYDAAKALAGLDKDQMKGFVDGASPLACPPQSAAARSVFVWLAGDTPASLRGPTNSLTWLSRMTRLGIGGPADPAAVHRLDLRWRLTSGIGAPSDWSDGVDDDLLHNVERAGLRSYFDALSLHPQRGSEARRILAEPLLATDPAAARRLFLSLDNRSLTRLLELEGEGRVPFVADRADIAFWAEAARTLFGPGPLASRMIAGAKSYNGGAIPTSPVRPAIAAFKPLPVDPGDSAIGLDRPIALRALVDPAGRPIWVESCLPERPTSNMLVDARYAFMQAARRFHAADPAKLPALPVARTGNRAAYGWVLLPQVQFRLGPNNTQLVEYLPANAANCVYSTITDMPPLPRAPSAR